MATTKQSKGKKAKPKAAKGKPAVRPKTPSVVVANHRFEPGSKVGFYPYSAVGVERGLGREPIPSATKTAKVAKDGVLKVSGLGGGMWLAAAPVGDRYRYFQFSVKGK